MRTIRKKLWIWLVLLALVMTGCAAETANDAAGQSNEEPDPANPAATVPAIPAVGNADVLFVRAVAEGDGRWTFHVTVSHPDTGWEDYADGWDVVVPNGEVLKKKADDPFSRVLLHPHENEQPFTRSQNGLLVPGGISLLTVRAHDLVDGFGGQEVVVDLAAASGPNFEVVRP